MYQNFQESVLTTQKLSNRIEIMLAVIIFHFRHFRLINDLRVFPHPLNNFGATGRHIFSTTAIGRGSVRQKISECAFRSSPCAGVRAAEPPRPPVAAQLVENENSVANSVATMPVSFGG